MREEAGAAEVWLEEEADLEEQGVGGNMDRGETLTRMGQGRN